MIDFHCHLDLYDKPFDVVKQCKEKNLHILSVTTTPKAWEITNRMSDSNDKIKTSLGLHPQLAHQRFSELSLFDRLIKKVKYVGEIGLDGGSFYKKYQKDQLNVFRHILNTVQISGGKIMSIHSAKSAGDVLSELYKFPDAGIPVMHWFTGSESDLKKAINYGCWFSVGPAMLASKNGKDMVKNIPRDRILTETDGPFAKFKNNILMPWDVNIALELLAELWQIPIKEVSGIINLNFKNLLLQS